MKTHIETDEEYLNRKKIIDEHMETYIRNFTTVIELELNEIYEALVGDVDWGTHTELLQYINQLKNTEEEFKYQNNIA